MLSASLPLLGPAAAGLGGLPFGTLASAGAGMAGLAMAGLFVALLGAFSPGHQAEKEADWTRGFGRRSAALCATVFALVGLLAAGLAWQVWMLAGPGMALGLAALSLACLAAALGFGRRALQRR
ncbi:hypothetical protein [Falsiroseomonas oryziterrae]|uniref:hypothetical protein n=1 Tax=Falsiroseomonas oryziterrae TaxID=2911368 RepID=UPI001F2A0C1C|nr:hypothetical protein [Roseomonas sp. NPKOSM-4]